MAPPIPIYTQREIRSMYPTVFDRTNKNCTLHELTQNQCTFDGVEIICLPFTRIFAKCLLEEDKKGRKYQHVELTGVNTNDYKKFNEYYKRQNNGEDILKKFLEADKIFRKAFMLKIEKELEESD